MLGWMLASCWQSASCGDLHIRSLLWFLFSFLVLAFSLPVIWAVNSVGCLRTLLTFKITENFVNFDRFRYICVYMHICCISHYNNLLPALSPHPVIDCRSLSTPTLSTSVPWEGATRLCTHYWSQPSLMVLLKYRNINRYNYISTHVHIYIYKLPAYS